MSEENIGYSTLGVRTIALYNQDTKQILNTFDSQKYIPYNYGFKWKEHFETMMKKYQMLLFIGRNNLLNTIQIMCY